MKKYSTLSAILVISLLLISGCVVKNDNLPSSLTSSSSNELVENVPMRFSGTLFSGFEAYYFSPAGLDEKWWIDYDSNKAKNWSIIESRLNAMKCNENLTYEGRKVPCRFQGKSVKLTARAILTKKGNYGHLGKYGRKIKFIDVLE